MRSALARQIRYHVASTKATTTGARREAEVTEVAPGWERIPIYGIRNQETLANMPKQLVGKPLGAGSAGTIPAPPGIPKIGKFWDLGIPAGPTPPAMDRDLIGATTKEYSISTPRRSYKTIPFSAEGLLFLNHSSKTEGLGCVS